MIDQGAVPVRATEMVAELPAHIVVVPLIVAVGLGLIVTTAVPENTPVQPVASLTAVKLYVVVAAGDTVKVYGDEAIPGTVTGVTPLVYVRFHGPVPVRATDRVADAPLHIEVVPLKVAVGAGLTVTVSVKGVPAQVPENGVTL